MAIVTVKGVDTSFMSKATQSQQMTTLNNPATGSAVEAYQYPLTINGASDRHPSYLVFYAVKQETNGMATNTYGGGAIEKRGLEAVKGNFKENTVAVIQMYIPNMMDTLSHTYDMTESSFAKDMFNVLGTAMNSNASVTEKAGEAATGMKDVMVSHVSKALGDKTGAFDARRGTVTANRNVQLYKSTGLRQCVFNFQLRPRNLAELKEVGRIINAFQVYSSATNTGAADLASVTATGMKGNGDVSDTGWNVIEVPPTWYIEERINRQDNQYNVRNIPKFAMGPAAVTSVRINKTPDQLYETFANTAGDPVSIDLEITVQELRPVYSDYWKRIGKSLGKTDSGDFFFGSFKD